MDASADKPCANCAALERRIAASEAKLAQLQKNSANSSKPPSSDASFERHRQAAPARPASVNGVGSRAIRDTSGRRSRRKASTSGWITRSACAPIVAAAPRRSISRRESCSRWKSSRRRPRSASIAARPATAGVARRRTTPRFPRPVAQRVRQSQRQPGRRLRPTADRVARASGAQRRRNGPQGKRPD